MFNRTKKSFSSTGQRPNSNGQDAVITTYPEKKSRNVGDMLITASAIDLIRHRCPDYDPVIVYREKPLEKVRKRNFRTILAPGFSVNDRTYPDLFKLYQDKERLKGIFFPVGCSFQCPSPTREAYKRQVYSESTADFLAAISSDQPIPCRDYLISEMLKERGYPAFYCGDLALYEHEYIGSKFVAPRKIRKLAFTVHHNPKFNEQSFELLRLVKATYPDTALYVVHHSRINEHARAVADYAKSLGFEERDLSGDVQNLSFYDDIDLHVGYRLHGHLYFLRKRKPSFLMIEDSRAFGISESGALKVGSFRATLPDSDSVDVYAPERLIKASKKSLQGGYEEFESLFQFIDCTYRDVVRPYFDDLATAIGWTKPLHLKVYDKFRGLLKGRTECAV